jgi:hypothetical protein
MRNGNTALSLSEKTLTVFCDHVRIVAFLINKSGSWRIGRDLFTPCIWEETFCYFLAWLIFDPKCEARCSSETSVISEDMALQPEGEVITIITLKQSPLWWFYQNIHAISYFSVYARYPCSVSILRKELSGDWIISVFTCNLFSWAESTKVVGISLQL